MGEVVPQIRQQRRAQGTGEQAGALVPSRTSCLVVEGEEDIPLSSLAHPGSSGRLPAPGARIPGLRPSRPSKLFPQSLPPHHSFLSHEAPLPPKSRQPLAKAQVEAFDPGFGARGQESLPYLRRMLGLPGSRPQGPCTRLYPQPLVPASLAAGGGRGPAATSPHEAEPMAGSRSGQPEAAVTRVTFSHIWFLSFLSAADGSILARAARGALVLGGLGRGVEGWGGARQGEGRKPSLWEVGSEATLPAWAGVAAGLVK